MKNRLLIILTTLLLASPLAAEERVKGVVLADGGTPLVGASVSIEGTTQSTITDEEGRFELRADKGAKLTVNYIGYATGTVLVSGDSEMRIVLTKGDASHVIDKRSLTTNHRFATWGEFGMSIQPEAFDNNEKFEQFTCVGGGIGLGYQLRHKRFLLTAGLELASINYHIRYNYQGAYTSGTLDLDCRRLQLQEAILAGMELRYWYWQAGAKFGFFSYYYLYNKHQGIDSKDFNKPYGGLLAIAPSFEIGYNETSARNINYKVAAFVEPYIDVLNKMPSGANASGDKIDKPRFYYLLFGLKFCIAY